MHPTRLNFRLLTIVLTLLAVLAVSNTLAAEPPLAEVENLGDTLVFHPVVEFAQLILTVTGPCEFQYRQVVTKGEPYFRLDETTIDGAYTFDLVRLEPIDPDVVDILQQARKNNDDETPKALCRAGKLPGAPVSQSEGFTVSRQEIIYDPESVEKAFAPDADARAGALGSIPTKDFVINDDLIVDGSACIGFDCVNGESFGFDTLRLKEHNLRIKFDDTSTAASFPRNDWQLTANASANGGASKFSIDDISGSRTPFTVEANARSHALYVDDGGRIGSRTSTPSVEIHTIDGDTPTLRLQQDGSSGFAPQTWDVAGNETNFFVRDVTNGSTLPFRIRPTAPTSSIFIDVDGDVGIGTASPDGSVHVTRNEDDAFLVGLVLENTDSTPATNGTGVGFRLETGQGSIDINAVAQASDNEFRINIADGDGAELTLDADGNLVVSGSVTPDYVFEADYPLMPLAELAAFIEREGHLPNIPSAEESRAIGKINLKGFQMKLLEKVEELTLYTLSQEETIQSQQETIQALERRLAALEEAGDR